MGLDGLLRSQGDRFIGILNGLDTSVWDPATDADLAAPYSRADPSGKAACRADLLTRIGFDPADDGPVIGMIGRLDPQKGFDLLAAAAPDAAGSAARGSSSRAPATRRSPTRSARWPRRRPTQVALIERFDRDMARRIYAGADFFAMPSRFEPCGQGQMIALRYGTPPIVHRTGGLADTVVDETTQPGAGNRLRLRRRDDRSAARGVRSAPSRSARPAARPWDALLDRAWPSTSTGRRAGAALCRGVPSGCRDPPSSG